MKNSYEPNDFQPEPQEQGLLAPPGRKPPTAVGTGTPSSGGHGPGGDEYAALKRRRTRRLRLLAISFVAIATAFLLGVGAAPVAVVVAGAVLAAEGFRQVRGFISRSAKRNLGLCLASLLFVMAGGGCAPEVSDTSVPLAASAEATEDAVVLQAEVIVAREMLRSYAGHRAVVDSLFAIAEQAPGGASGEVRPGFRTQALQDSLADSQHTASSVVLHLSKPSIRDGVAQITVTIDFPDPRSPAGRGYETVHYTLDRNGASWRIRTRVQLGIT